MLANWKQFSATLTEVGSLHGLKLFSQPNALTVLIIANIYEFVFVCTSKIKCADSISLSFKKPFKPLICRGNRDLNFF